MSPGPQVNKGTLNRQNISGLKSYLQRAGQKGQNFLWVKLILYCTMLYQQFSNNKKSSLEVLLQIEFLQSDFEEI